MRSPKSHKCQKDKEITYMEVVIIKAAVTQPSNAPRKNLQTNNWVKFLQHLFN